MESGIICNCLQAVVRDPHVGRKGGGSGRENEVMWPEMYKKLAKIPSK
jgi:hypothetical protein